MAKQNTEGLTVQDKCDYYTRRANDPKLSERQRSWARMRLGQLCGGVSGKGKQQKFEKIKSAVPTTTKQLNARNAGIGYGAAKVGRAFPSLLKISNRLGTA